MVLNQLKQIREELKNSADAYDRAFKNIAIIAAQELNDQNSKINNQLNQADLSFNNSQCNKLSLNPSLNKEDFIEKYGTLKNAKIAYQKMYGEQKYGRTWSDFITVAKRLDVAKKADVSKPEELSLEVRIDKIEQFLKSLGYQP
ncbi:MAG: hypothetical protein ACRC80_23180 [Waterburya sp.]